MNTCRHPNPLPSPPNNSHSLQLLPLLARPSQSSQEEKKTASSSLSELAFDACTESQIIYWKFKACRFLVPTCRLLSVFACIPIYRNFQRMFLLDLREFYALRNIAWPGPYDCYFSVYILYIITAYNRTIYN